VGEHLVDIEGVAGSIPAAPTTLTLAAFRISAAIQDEIFQWKLPLPILFSGVEGHTPFLIGDL
jgi:hypothetical protein